MDRLDFARDISSGMRVLDIGGGLMPGSDEHHPFVVKYRKIRAVAKQYRAVDCQKKPDVDYVIDFNERGSGDKLGFIIDEYKPDVILCMETLEHVNCHNDIMRELAGAVRKFGTVVFITIPNNGNWLLNLVKKWRSYHILAFFEDIARNFIRQSDLGKFDVWQIPCIGNYYWWWRLFYAASFFQPMSWGFFVQRPGMSIISVPWKKIS